MVFVNTSLWFFSVLMGCDDGSSEADELRSELEDLTIRLDEMQATIEEQSSTIAEQSTAISTLEDQLEAVTNEQVPALSSSIEQNTTDIDAIVADYLTSADLEGLATETWVGDQGYLTSADLTDLTSAVAANTAGLAVVEGDYLTSADLTGLATESWVSGQGYASATEVSANASDIAANATDIAAIYADYLTSADLSGYALESDVSDNAADIAAIMDDYLTSTDLDGAATEEWVEEQIADISGAYEVQTITPTSLEHEEVIDLPGKGVWEMTIWMEAEGANCGGDTEESFTIYSTVLFVTDLGDGINSQTIPDQDTIHTGSHSERCQAYWYMSLTEDDGMVITFYNSQDTPITINYRAIYQPE